MGINCGLAGLTFFGKLSLVVEYGADSRNERILS
jgi:hypothetical protein